MTPNRSPRVHVEPTFTWKPITKLRRREHTAHYGETRSGTRYFLFGVIAIWTRWDRREVAR